MFGYYDEDGNPHLAPICLEIDGKTIFPPTTQQYIAAGYVDLSAPKKCEFTLDEARLNKVSELSQICQSNIYSGQILELTDGSIDFFNYSEVNQINISSAFNAAMLAYQKSGEKKSVPLYNAQNVCKLYSFEDISMLYISMQNYITYNLTLCHQLQDQVKGMTDVAAINEITFDAQCLDEQHQKTFTELISAAEQLVVAVQGGEES